VLNERPDIDLVACCMWAGIATIVILFVFAFFL
jgi:hypothetical protein